MIASNQDHDGLLIGGGEHGVLAALSGFTVSELSSFIDPNSESGFEYLSADGLERLYDGMVLGKVWGFSCL